MEVGLRRSANESLQVSGSHPDFPIDDLRGVRWEYIGRAAPEGAKLGAPQGTDALHEIGVARPTAGRIQVPKGRDLDFEAGQGVGRCKEDQFTLIAGVVARLGNI